VRAHRGVRARHEEATCSGSATRSRGCVPPAAIARDDAVQTCGRRLVAIVAPANHLPGAGPDRAAMRVARRDGECRPCGPVHRRRWNPLAIEVVAPADDASGLGLNGAVVQEAGRETRRGAGRAVNGRWRGSDGERVAPADHGARLGLDGATLVEARSDGRGRPAVPSTDAGAGPPPFPSSPQQTTPHSPPGLRSCTARRPRRPMPCLHFHHAVATRLRSRRNPADDRAAAGLDRAGGARHASMAEAVPFVPSTDGVAPPPEPQQTTAPVSARIAQL
jgi:hypothetical protein